MRKKIVRFSTLPALCALLFLSFSKKGNDQLNTGGKLIKEVKSFGFQSVKLPSESTDAYLPILQKQYTGFKEALGFKESRGDYGRVNKFGYLGKYQFGRGTLALIGVYNTTAFLNDPKLQELAFYANTARNKWILKRDIARYSGKTVRGVKVTESGILAAAHLAGPGSVKKYLRSGGAFGFSDAFGTSISHYMRKFEGYDVSFVKADRYPKVQTLFEHKTA